MPPVVAVISAVVSAIATISTWVISIGGLQLAIGKALLYVVGSVVMSAIARALTPTPEFDSGSTIDQGYEVALKFDPAFPRQIVVGRAATGGSIAYAQVTGTDNKFLWRVAALSDNPSHALYRIESSVGVLTFDGDVTTGWRNCTSHFLKADGSTACLRVRVYLGTQTTADADLVAATSEWTSACVGTGITYAIWRMEYDADAFKSGEPDLIFVLDGALAYDPRDNTTKWTRNAELLAAQFAQGWEINGVRVIGLGASADDVPEAYVEEGADICDEQVALAAGGTEDRYQANGLISSYDQPSAVMIDFAMAMAGQHIDAGGEIIVRPGRAQTPVHLLGRALTDLDLLGDAPDEWTPDRPGDELCNTIHSTFVDPNAAWREQPLPIRKDTAAIADDGARFVKNRSYRFVTSNTQGQRLNKFALTDTRQQGRATIAVGLWGIAYEPGDWEEWTSAYFGGATFTFRIEAVNFDISDGSDGSEPKARILLTIAETHESVDDWSTDDEDQLTGAFPAQVPFSLAMNALTVTTAVLSLGGASVPQLRAAWSAIGSPVATSIEFEYRVVSDSVVYRGAARPDATAVAFDQGIMPAQTYEMRARVRAIDRVGAWTNWTAHSGTTSSILIDNALVAEPFAPGRIGGSGNFVFALDKSGPSTTDVGEIYITADRFNHPDGTQRTSGLTGTVLTPYGEGQAGRFYLIYSQTAKATRFSGLAGSQGTATNIFAARIKSSGGWEAFDDSGNVVDVTIASTDCILALVEAEGTASGLTGIAPMVSGAAGIDGVVATYAQTTAPTSPNIGDVWYDSDDANRRTYRWSGSAWVQIADQTPYNTAAAIAGQGALATQNSADWGTQVSSRPTELTDGRITAGLDASGDLNRNITTGRRNSSNLLGYAGGATFTGELAADVTATHTAAAIAGQGTGATASTLAALNATDNANLAASIAVSPNLIPNPTGRWGTLDFWGQNGDAAVANYNEVPGRGRSFIIGYPASPGARNQQYYTDYITIEAGANVSLQAQIDHYNRASGSFKVSVACYNSSNTYLGDALSETFTTDRYGAWSKSGVTLTNTAKVRVVLDWTNVVGAGGGGSCVFRLFKLERWAAPTRYSEELALDAVEPGADQTSANTAAAITSQTAWATYSGHTPTGALAYMSTTGRINDWRGIPTNGLGGAGMARSNGSVSGGGSTGMDFNAVTLYVPGQGTLSLPSASVTGLSTATKYWGFYRIANDDYIVTSSFATAAAYMADASGAYVYVGSRTTGGGSFDNVGVGETP